MVLRPCISTKHIVQCRQTEHSSAVVWICRKYRWIINIILSIDRLIILCRLFNQKKPHLLSINSSAIPEAGNIVKQSEFKHRFAGRELFQKNAGRAIPPPLKRSVMQWNLVIPDTEDPSRARSRKFPANMAAHIFTRNVQARKKLTYK